jgi:hypothetical protein
LKTPVIAIIALVPQPATETIETVIIITIVIHTTITILTHRVVVPADSAAVAALAVVQPVVAVHIEEVVDKQ